MFKINNRAVGENSEVFIVAELSANHQQKYEIAEKTICEIKKSGADAVKIQTYTPDTITLDCDNEYFQIKQGTIWNGRNYYNLYKEAYTPWEWQPKLKKIAEDLGLIFFSSPFDFTAVDFLDSMNVPAYKIASFEITDIPLIEYTAKKQKPIIISTGIAFYEDIKLAVDTCKRVGNDQIALLKCTSEYPAPFEHLNLLMIPKLSQDFHTVVGLSDHTMSTPVPIASVALGAQIIEKHFILDRKMGGPDSSFSLEPNEFRDMVDAVRCAEKSLGRVDYELTPNVVRSRELSRSLFVIKDILKGEEFTTENVRSIRPGYGLHPKYLNDVIGKKAAVSIKRGTPLKKEHID